MQSHTFYAITVSHTKLSNKRMAKDISSYVFNKTKEGKNSIFAERCVNLLTFLIKDEEIISIPYLLHIKIIFSYK